MAHFLRGKQAGVQNDLSAGIIPELFALDDIARYGINAQTSTFTYDPIQSLLAVGTSESKNGSGQIYVFGQKRVSVVFPLPRKAGVKNLEFCADKLVCVTNKNELCIYSLVSNKLVSSHTPPSYITAMTSDPSLDWAFLGLQNGEIVAYDLDRQAMALWRIPNFWREQHPKARSTPIVSLELHPRDIGSMLIGYTDGAVIFSFKLAKALKFFLYELPPGAPGGDSDPTSLNSVRHPKLTQAVWHPTGTFILTAHEDSSLVFWDPKDGRLVLARTLQNTNVNRQGAALGSYGATPGTYAVKEPLFKVSWCCKENPDDTGLLIAGGTSTGSKSRGLTWLDLGPTPVYQTATWESLAGHFEAPKRQHILETPPPAPVVDFCLIPRSSPYFAGAQDPIAVVALLATGEITTLSFPSGHPISPTNQLHLSLSFVHPFLTHFDVASLERTRWLTMKEERPYGPPILKGGAEATHPLKRYEGRNIVQVAHADGTIRIWDAGHADEIEMGDVLQVDIARALGRVEDLEVMQMSMSGTTGELAVGLRSGEVVIFRWDRNHSFGREPPPPDGDDPCGLVNIRERADAGLKAGLMPLSMLKEEQGPICALKMSDIGFVAIGYESGDIAIIDLRGPAVIYQAGLSDIEKQSKRGSIRRSRQGQPPGQLEVPTSIEFGVMTVDNDAYSSILCFVGTSHSRFATFKILPGAGGRYSVALAGSITLESSPVISISPLNADSGQLAHAVPSTVAKLREGFKINGVVVVTTATGCRIFKPATAKGASKTWDEFLCHKAAIVDFDARGKALVGLFGDGTARCFSLPGLKELGVVKLRDVMETRRFKDAYIMDSGDIIGWSGPSEVAMVNVWGTGKSLPKSQDKLFNPELTLPPRPTISNLQWISGTQYVTPTDMDILIGGPDRPPSEKQRAAVREAQKRGGNSRAGTRDEGWGEYMQRQLNERTEQLGLAGDSMDRVQENSAGWQEDVSKFVGRQKRNIVMGGLKSKFGF